MRIFAVLIIFCLAGCKNSAKTPVIINKVVKNDPGKHDFNFRDSVSALLNTSFNKDTFEYIAFYNEKKPYQLLYFKMGFLFNAIDKYAIALYTINDTSIVCDLFSRDSDQWIKSSTNDTLKISEFSPAFFNTNFRDYNFDGVKDFKIDLYTSMGQGYSYGYLLIFDTGNNSLRLHPTTIEIPNMEMNTKEKTIYSIVYSNPNEDRRKFKIISNYKWVNDTLKLSFQKKIISKG